MLPASSACGTRSRARRKSYQKHNPQQLHSYRLDFVGEHEKCGNKVPYEGTLDDLYNNDFFKFIEYNKQDVVLLVKIDAKRRYIELANQIAHVNCVLLKTTMGSVALVEQAIMGDMHEQGIVAPDRRKEWSDKEDTEEDEEEKTPVVGAYVAKPKTGIHDHVACVDINSLYPSAIRALNISPETIVGQIKQDETMALVEERVKKGVPRAEAWDGIFETLEVKHVFDQSGAPVTVDFDDGRTETKSGREWYAYIFNPRNKLCVSANGTIFRTDKDGIIPQLLAKWYKERQEMQGLKKQFAALVEGSVELPPELAEKVAKLMGLPSL
jgi:DNA polymerase elongation subunit (family B)